MDLNSEEALGSQRRKRKSAAESILVLGLRPGLCFILKKCIDQIGKSQL